MKVWIIYPNDEENDDRRKNHQTLQPRPTEDNGENFADISDEK